MSDAGNERQRGGAHHEAAPGDVCVQPGEADVDGRGVQAARLGEIGSHALALVEKSLGRVPPREGADRGAGMGRE
jgi:hypothetical protein